MTILLAILKTYWLHLVAFGLGAWLAFGFQETRIERVEAKHTAYVNAVDTAVLKAQAEALAKEKQWLQEKEDAQIAAKEREAKLKADVAATRAGADRLRGDLAALRSRLSSAPQTTVLDTADTALAVLGDCAAAYGDMAAAADGHRNDAQTLMEAWPK